MAPEWPCDQHICFRESSISLLHIIQPQTTPQHAESPRSNQQCNLRPCWKHQAANCKAWQEWSSSDKTGLRHNGSCKVVRRNVASADTIRALSTASRSLTRSDSPSLTSATTMANSSGIPQTCTKTARTCLVSGDDQTYPSADSE